MEDIRKPPLSQMQCQETAGLSDAEKLDVGTLLGAIAETLLLLVELRIHIKNAIRIRIAGLCRGQG